MRQIRLLPVVIVAGIGLLGLKTIGIMNGGGYVLTGPAEAVAAGPASKSGGAAALALPVEPTLTDAAPTLDDHAPTLPLAETAAAHGTGGGQEEGSAIEGMPDISQTAEANAVAEVECPEVGGPQSMIFVTADGCAVPMTDQGEVVPMIRNEAGVPVPLSELSGSPGSEGAILDRLSERRSELDLREAELGMRLALVEAAERRIDERTVALEALEQRINALVDEKRTLEEAQFTAVVSMYETMKPKDAAAIFDQLDMQVLLRVARGISPRKMAPIMARMSPLKAQALTTGLAVDQVEPTIDLSGDSLASLPQIVGQ